MATVTVYTLIVIFLFVNLGIFGALAAANAIANKTMSDFYVNIAVFAPFNQSYQFSMARVLPAVESAMHEINTRRILDHLVLKPTPIDSEYPEDLPVAIEAIRLLYNESKPTHLLIGPISDVSLHTVSRVAAFKNVAIISPGGFSVNFGVNRTTDSTFRTLVRVGPTVNFLFNMMRSLWQDKYGFHKVKLLCDKHQVMYLDFCNRFHWGFDYYLNLYKNDPNRTGYKLEFDTYPLPKIFDPEEVLRDEVGVDFAGKILTLVFFVRF